MYRRKNRLIDSIEVTQVIMSSVTTFTSMVDVLGRVVVYNVH